MFRFDWNYVPSGAPYVTVSETGLAFNTPAVALLDNAEEVIVGFDKTNLAIGVMKYDGRSNTKPYKFYGRVKNGWVRIGCRDFIKHLTQLSGISFSSARRYTASYDEAEGVLYIEVLKNGGDGI